MDWTLALALKTLALACACGAAVLALGGFIDFLVSGHWPDQSLLRLAYDARLVGARWFLLDDWRMPLRDILDAVPAALALLAAAPLFWAVAVRFGRR
jgi:hypothetical protein